MTREQYLKQEFISGTITEEERKELVYLVFGNHYKITGEHDERYFCQVLIESSRNRN